MTISLILIYSYRASGLALVNTRCETRLVNMRSHMGIPEEREVPQRSPRARERERDVSDVRALECMLPRRTESHRRSASYR